MVTRAETYDAESASQRAGIVLPLHRVTYGRPIEFWFTTLAKLRGMKRMEMVSHLKLNHGMGHGHANAIVAAYRSREQ